MSDEARAFFFGLFVGTAVGVVVCIACNEDWRTDMVRRGFAEYSQTTGEWQWKEAAK
jgi:hypothetical protein